MLAAGTRLGARHIRDPGIVGFADIRGAAIQAAGTFLPRRLQHSSKTWGSSRGLEIYRFERPG